MKLHTSVRWSTKYDQLERAQKRWECPLNSKLMFCFVLFPVFTLLANSYPLAKLYQQGFLLLYLFPGDNPHLMAEIPVFSSCRHYTTFPYRISHFMSYSDLMVTLFFFQAITRHLSVSSGNASEHRLTDSPSWHLPPFGQGWTAAALRGISPAVSI